MSVSSSASARAVSDAVVVASIASPTIMVRNFICLCSDCLYLTEFGYRFLRAGGNCSAAGRTGHGPGGPPLAKLCKGATQCTAQSMPEPDGRPQRGICSRHRSEFVPGQGLI